MISAFMAIALATEPATHGPTPYNWITPKRDSDSATVLYYTGNQFIELCDKDRTACLTYMLGVIDGQASSTFMTDRVTSYKYDYTRVTAGQLFAVVEKFLNDNPADRHLPAAVLIANALVSAFPRGN
jgi:hypothetical protein